MAWTYQYWTGSAWSSATTLDNPWQVEPVYQNTDRVYALANGKEGRISVSTKIWSSLRLSWDMKDQTFRDTVFDWIENNRTLKFVDHNSDEYIVKLNSASFPHKIVNGDLGYAVTIECRQVPDPSA